ncbi:MAG TPA: hypothetical protein VFS08_17445 [Gemmatimonadaceae bacterium]|nr:hypothetical protein [Gemmatimonadaceae bacterium]
MIGAGRRYTTPMGFAGVACLMVACSGDGADARTAAVVRDSAGVQIVENAAAAWSEAEAPRLADAPALVIGDASGEGADALYRVAAVHRRPDGRLVVADGGSAQLRIYGADGALLHVAGGEGGGPGEFRRLTWLDVGADDSILAYDAGQRRFAVFDDTGAFVRVFAPAATGDRPTIARPVALLRDGDVVATQSTLLGDGPPTLDAPVRDTVAFVRIGRDGAVRELAARVPGDERVIHMSPGAVEIVTPPFAPRLVVAADGDRLYAARGDGYELAQYDTTGRLLRLVRVPGLERRVASEDVEAHIERVTAGTTDPAARQRRAAGLRALPVRERMPAVAQLVVDDAGRLWAMDFLAPRDSAATWRVFDAEGGYLGTVSMPRTFTVHEIADDRVLGVYRDENDVEQVRVYALEDGR